MKSKGEKIALVAAIIIVLLYITIAVSAIVFGVVFFRKNVKIIKESITAERFIEEMKEEGFDVKPIEYSVYNNSAEGVKEAYSASNGKYTIEFYSFNNTDDAIGFFDTNKSKVKVRSAYKEINLSGRNYDSYTLVNNGRYNFIERIENTVIVIKGSSSHEKDSKSIIKNFGY